MFASQLLRILQTVPPRVNNETCGASDTIGTGTIMKENQNGFHNNPTTCENDDTASLRDQKESDAVPLASKSYAQDAFLDSPELECTVVVEDSIGDGKNKVRGQNDTRDGASLGIPSRKVELFQSNENDSRNKNEARDSGVADGNPFIETELFKKKMDLFADKNVPGCELPELIVCYTESTSYAVKDICIDDGDPSEDKTLIEMGKEKVLHSFIPSNGYENGDMTIETRDIRLHNQGGLNSLSSENLDKGNHESGTKEKMDSKLIVSDHVQCPSESDFDTSPVEVHRSANPLIEDNDTCDAMDNRADDNSGEMIVQKGMHLLQEFGKQKSLNPFLESLDSNGNEVKPQFVQSPHSEAKNETAAEELNKSSLVGILSYNSKVGSSTIIFDFNSKTAASSGSESPDTVKALRTGSESTSDGLTDTNGVRGDRGESSFSMAGPVSGLITYSGPIAYSGSTSLRSDSSATSTRSFAFPILHSEWNNSPVRMAKADQRHFRKHRGWRQGLFCCRF